MSNPNHDRMGRFAGGGVGGGSQRVDSVITQKQIFRRMNKTSRAKLRASVRKLGGDARLIGPASHKRLKRDFGL